MGGDRYSKCQEYYNLRAAQHVFHGVDLHTVLPSHREFPNSAIVSLQHFEILLTSLHSLPLLFCCPPSPSRVSAILRAQQVY